MRLDGIKNVGAVRWLRRLRHRHRFWRSAELLHYGMYPSFQAAAQAIPADKTVRWTHPGLVDNLQSRVNPRDYPVLFWLQKLWHGRVRVFDLGGYLGSKRHAFEAYLSFDDDKHWIVCDVPEVVAAGRRIALERKTPNLSFTGEIREASGCSVLLCLGVLQFLEPAFPAQLRELSELPAHVIVNGLPLHPRMSYVTLVNHVGSGMSPYRVFHSDAFIAEMQALGYHLVDRWANVEKGCRVSVDRELDVEHYSGLYFRRTLDE